MRVQVAKFVVFAVCVLPTFAFAQLEVSGGWSHLTGNNGLNGFSGEAGYEFNRKVVLVGQGSFLWNTSKLSSFDLVPSTGSVRIKSNEQNYLFGGRVRLTGWKATRGLQRKKLLPFGELLFGWSRLHQEIKDVTGTISASASDRAFTWLLGGGLDYRLSSRWYARGNLDYVRTHFADQGQNRLRIGIGLVYVF